MQLPDINFWVALVLRGHEHHASALEWFENSPHGICHFCRNTHLGMMRLTTNRKMFGDATMTLAEAWQAYHTLRAEPAVGFQEELPGVMAEFERLTYLPTFAHKYLNDAYLAAFAKVADLEIVTFDTGFRQFAGLKLTVLS
jgi:uncharacterized protein